MKRILIVLMLAASLVLAACGASSTASTQTAAAAEAGTLSLATQLVVGTLKLEGTDNAVTAEEAATLLPLWQAYQALGQGDTTAQEELDGLAQQIKSAMTSAQISAITAMNLTQQDIFTTMQTQGINNGPSASGTPNAIQVPDTNNGGFNPGGAGDAGGPPSGSMPGGGAPAGGPPSGSMPSGSDQGTGQMMQTTPQAGQSQVTGITNRVPTALVNALIELLKSKQE